MGTGWGTTPGAPPKTEGPPATPPGATTAESPPSSGRAGSKVGPATAGDEGEEEDAGCAPLDAEALRIGPPPWGRVLTAGASGSNSSSLLVVAARIGCSHCERAGRRGVAAELDWDFPEPS